MPKSRILTAETKISAKQLGELLGIGPERLRQLKRDGFIQAPRGQYTIQSGVRGYIRFKTRRRKQAPQTELARLLQRTG